MSDSPTKTIYAIVSALNVMRERPEVIALSRRTIARMTDEARWLGMRHDPAYEGRGNTIAGVKFATSRRDDLDPDTIDIRDLDGHVLMRIADV